ncbi:hypothetical protein [Aminobacter sp. HY435]|uniref:hypothetical protein n=1 Tax=Aminobacter sp. HY435 TaxID=2970917 RepID=UPI0022B96DBF|nr:hypothetical protein [Aminobacter sp. HY435]
MKKFVLAIGVVALVASATAALAADQNHMLDACRAYASKHLHVDASIINVKYEGQRTDGTHAVNGDTETSPPMTFQCSFRADGKRVVRWVHDSPKGCPADVSEANRYLYPDC